MDRLDIFKSKNKRNKEKHKHVCHCKHIDFKFEWLEDKIELLSSLSKAQTEQLKLIPKEIKKMAQTLAELQAAIEAVTVAVDADVEQTALVVKAVGDLIAKIKASGTTDFQAEVSALAAATSKLSSDNAAVQTALDEAGTA